MTRPTPPRVGVKEQVELDPAVSRILQQLREYTPDVTHEVIDVDEVTTTTDEVVGAFTETTESAFAVATESAFAEPVESAFAATVESAFSVPEEGAFGESEAFANGVFSLPDLFTDVEALGLFSGGKLRSIFSADIAAESAFSRHKVQVGLPFKPVVHILPPPLSRPIPVRGHYLAMEDYMDSFPRATDSLYLRGMTLSFTMAKRSRGMDCSRRDPCEWWHDYWQEYLNSGVEIEGLTSCEQHPLIAEPFRELVETMAYPSWEAMLPMYQKVWVEMWPIAQRLREKMIEQVDELAMIPLPKLEYIIRSSGWVPPKDDLSYPEMHAAIVEAVQRDHTIGLGAVWADTMVQHYAVVLLHDKETAEDVRELTNRLGVLYQLRSMPVHPLQICIFETFHAPIELAGDGVDLEGDYRIVSSMYRSMLTAPDYDPRVGTGEWGWLLHNMVPVDRRGQEATITAKPA